MKHGEFPTQAVCDPKKPDEAFAWALVALPHLKGAAMIFPAEYLQMISEHLWKCGFRWHRKYQEIEWWAPASDDPHWLRSPGRWVKKGTPRPDYDQKVNMVTVLDAMKKADEDDFFAALDYINKRDDAQ